MFSISSILIGSASETSGPPNRPFHLWILASLTPCLRKGRPPKPRLVLVQDADDLLFRKTLALRANLRSQLKPPGARPPPISARVAD